ncbi:MAG: serine hydrolase [Salinivirgaceae bacterium]|nr:serine hydrolase [Salinivirgaceae bacterium]MDD4746966.1 serine hydrolase [Salinivirgaceae bacterium]
MRRLILFVIVIISLGGCKDGSKNQNYTPDFKSIDRFLEQSILDWNVPGMAVGIIYDDSIVLSKGYGYMDLIEKDPVTDSTLFGIASLTKGFSALAIGMAQYQAYLDINKPIKFYLPQFKTQNDSLTNNINFVDILSHRTGYSTFSGDLSWYGNLKSKYQVLESIKSIPVSNDLRSVYGYSNVMYLTAGLALEAATGQNFESFVTDFILSPLKMYNTTFDYSKVIQSSNTATPHVVENNKPMPINYVNWSNMAPAGGLFSNVVDLLKWAQFQWNPNYSYIDSVYFNAQHEIITKQRFSWLDNLNGDEIKMKGYGLGWEIIEIGSYKTISHNGGLDGMISQIVVVPEMKCAIVVLANSGSALPIILGYELSHRLLIDSKNTYYNLSLRKIKENASIDRKTEFDQEQKRDLSYMVGEYYDSLMGGVSIVNSNAHHYELKFEQATLFDATIFVDNKGKIVLQWKNILSLPNGEIVEIDTINNILKSFTIRCPNPDFRFEEINFRRR